MEAHTTHNAAALLLAALATTAVAIAQASPIEQDEVQINVDTPERYVTGASVARFGSGFASTWVETDAELSHGTLLLRTVDFHLDLSDISETDSGLAFGVRSRTDSLEFSFNGVEELLTGAPVDEAPGTSGDLGTHRWRTGETSLLIPLSASHDNIKLAPWRLSSRFGVAYVSDESTDTNDIHLGRLTIPDNGFVPSPQLQEVTAGAQFNPDVAYLQFPLRGLASDRYLVVWQSIGAPGDGMGATVHGRFADGDMTPVGNQFQISPASFEYAGSPVVAANPRGGALVIYGSSHSFGDDDSEGSVQAQLFDEQGALVGAPFQVNTYTPGQQAFASVAALDNGEYVVVWNDRQRGVIVAQRLAQDGSHIGGEFLINRTTSTADGYPDIAANGNDFLVVWEAQGGIWANGVVEGRLFEDGFESGDATSWSLTIP